MTNLLLIDNTNNSLNLAIYLNNELRVIHNEQINGEIAIEILDKYFQAHNLQINLFDTIVFCKGPGSFVGSRITVSIVQGLVLGSQLKCVSLSALEILKQVAQNKNPQNQEDIFVAIDAREKESYVCAYNQKSAELIEEQLFTQTQLEEYIKQHPKQNFIGNSFAVYLEPRQIKDLNIIEFNQNDKINAMLEIAQKYIANANYTSLENIQPNYIRNKVV